MKPPLVLAWAREAPVRGRIACFRQLLFATIDERPFPEGHAERSGVGAFDRETGDPLWSAWNLPALAALDEARLYLYSRAGELVCLGFEGEERWRAPLTDDRSPPARARGDRDAPFVADVVPLPGGVAVATGGEVVLLDPECGGARALATVARGERAVVHRIAALDEGLVCTCTERTDTDDELVRHEPALWRTTPKPEALRTAPGELVALGPDLEERWRIGPGSDDVTFGGLRPAVVGEFVVVAAPGVASDDSGRHRSTYDHRLLAFDAMTGEARWHVELSSGIGCFDPVATPSAVVVGGDPALHVAADGRERWRLDAGALRIEIATAPLIEADRILFAADGRVLAVDMVTGEIAMMGRFAPQPFAGAVTTDLAIAEGMLYVGVAEAARPIELRSVPLTLR